MRLQIDLCVSLPFFLLMLMLFSPSMIGGVAMTMIAARISFDRAGRPLQRSCQSDMQNGERGRQEGGQAGGPLSPDG